MKRTIAFLLTLVLLLSLVTAVSADFTDGAKIKPEFQKAVQVMSEKKIIAGFEDGSFKPIDTLTRAQAAKIICSILVGADKVDAIQAASSFTDVPAGHWAEKFIGYCAEKGIVGGVGSGKFNPNGKLTSVAFAKMLLVAYGHDAEKEGFLGENWVVNVQKALRPDSLNFKVNTGEKPIPRQEACQMAYNFLLNDEIGKAEGYTQEKIVFNTKNVKVQGRAELTDSGVIFNYPGDAVEFRLDCKGTLEFTYTTEASHNILMFVDGEEFNNRVAITTSGSSAVGYRFVQPGEHTIRIVQDSEVNTSGQRATITGLSALCKKATMQASPAKSLYVEFIGDSITAGCCVSGQPGALVHAATKSYAHMTANRLDADYAQIAKGSIGLTKEVNNSSVEQMYLCQNPWKSKDTAAKTTRKPDVVVIAIGTNDAEETPDTNFYNLLKDFTAKVRKQAGDKAKIVFIHNMMKTRHGPTMEQLSKDLGGAAAGYYVFEMPQGNHGAASTAGVVAHPGIEDNQKSS